MNDALGQGDLLAEPPHLGGDLDVGQRRDLHVGGVGDQGHAQPVGHDGDIDVTLGGRGLGGQWDAHVARARSFRGDGPPVRAASATTSTSRRSGS
ncbi:MAG: hypothetical protein M3137_05770 [Actinomycetota bacterium]|nr:hypothetical protein [Actinomycetota bacterium]